MVKGLTPFPRPGFDDCWGPRFRIGRRVFLRPWVSENRNLCKRWEVANRERRAFFNTKSDLQPVRGNLVMWNRIVPGGTSNHRVRAPGTVTFSSYRQGVRIPSPIGIALPGSSAALRS